MIARIIEWSARNVLLVLFATVFTVAAGLWSLRTLPIDAIPDVFAGIGFTDDAAVIAALLATLGANVKRRHREAAEAALERLKIEDQ